MSNRLRIGIDAHAVGSRLGGNETYMLDLLRGLSEFPQHDYFIYVTDAKSRERVRALVPPSARVREIGAANPFVRLGWKLGALCREDAVDVLHVQYVAPIGAPPYVVTIHDLSFLHRPEWYTLRERLQMRATIPRAARHAREVMTISAYSRDDIVSRLGVPPNRVTWSHLPVREEFRPVPAPERAAALSGLALPQRYVLAVGNLQPRKNLLRLIAAWAALRESEPGFDHGLVIAGRAAWNFREILASAASNKFAHEIVLPGYVPDDLLPALYSGAEMFVYPSLFEGFGYPPLEAMACGVPVVTSRTTSLPEVCGDAAEYADPLEVNSIAAAMKRVHADPEHAAGMARRGLVQAEPFRKNLVTATAIAAYERAAPGGAG